ncbi:MAG TPA: ABATE domain-containing protein [Gammaproteobacteria bacterium]|nr:ABATE domain-containing protein [Gammaproteobacteria bacterium]
MSAQKLPEDRDGFRFRGGSCVIDLCATLRARLSPAPLELLVTPADLARWLVSSGMVEVTPEVTAEDLPVAKVLREAIYTLAARKGGPKIKEARQTLNQIAVGSPAVPQFKSDGTARLTGSASALLVSLAREAVQLFGSDMADLVRKCESPVCALYFVDTSRKGDRRWCSMSGCGNKAKVAEFRRRQRRSAKAGKRK